jgi:hypothetical protein
MQWHRTAAGIERRRPDAPAVTTVQGLGLCDVLRVELQPCQIAGAIDELDERRGPLEESYQRARTQWSALPDSERAPGCARTALEEALCALGVRAAGPDGPANATACA